MAKISSYTADSSIAGTEKLIGTDTDGTTLNYSLSDIATFMAGSGITATNGVLSVDSNDAITAGTGIDISKITRDLQFKFRKIIILIGININKHNISGSPNIESELIISPALNTLEKGSLCLYRDSR